jgi:hypothetical protein
MGDFIAVSRNIHCLGPGLNPVTIQTVDGMKFEVLTVKTKSRRGIPAGLTSYEHRFCIIWS